VATGTDVAAAVDDARNAGKAAIALQVERAGAGRRFVAIPLRTG
jgi:hypothetical protein